MFRKPESKMFKRGSFQSENPLDNPRVKLAQAAKLELASVGDVWLEAGEYLRTWSAPKPEDQRRIPRANQRLGDPLRASRESRDPGPQRRVVKRDLTPALTHVRDRDPTKLTRQLGHPERLRERTEVEDPREELGWRSEEHTSELQSHVNLV